MRINKLIRRFVGAFAMGMALAATAAPGAQATMVTDCTQETREDNKEPRVYYPYKVTSCIQWDKVVGPNAGNGYRRPLTYFKNLSTVRTYTNVRINVFLYGKADGTIYQYWMRECFFPTVGPGQTQPCHAQSPMYVGAEMAEMSAGSVGNFADDYWAYGVWSVNSPWTTYMVK